MILVTKDPSGQKKFFAGFYSDNTVYWSTCERKAQQESVEYLKAIATFFELDNYNIREVIPAKPFYHEIG